MFQYMLDSQEAENKTYQKMLQFAKDWLLQHEPQNTAKNAGVAFDEATSTFRFESLGQKIAVEYPSCRVTFVETGKTPYWLWNLIMLHYLYLADGTPLGSELVSFGQLPGGLARGAGFDKDCTDTIAKVFGHKPAEHVQLACEALGAVFTKSNADICAVFPFLPRYPVMLKIWFADDELEGSGKMLLNKQAPQYLSLEDAVVTGSMILDFLMKQYQQMFPDEGPIPLSYRNIMYS